MSAPIALTRLVKHMQRWQRLHYAPYHLLLSQEAIEHASREGYLALARLMKAHYFSVILTTNSNGLLERNLASVGVEFAVLSTDEDADEQTFQALEDLIDKVCLIKLSQGYEDKTTTTAPPSSALRTAIERYLSRDLIVVGPVMPNSKLMELIQPAESSSTYYCIHAQPSSEDSIVQLLQTKYSAKEDFLIPDKYGQFNTFFTTIVSLLRLKEPPPETSLDALPSPKPGKDTRSSKNTPVADPRNTIAQNTLTHLLPSKHPINADILLITVTEIEAQAILNYFPSSEKQIIDQQVYYDLGHIGPARTVMARSTHMGPFAAIHCVDEGIDHFSPHTAIMVGIAFGLRPHEQKIGDILVAKQIMNCDSQKIRTGPDNRPVILPRGSSIPVADHLLNCFQAGQLDWIPPPDIHFGQILSSWRLIDHKETRDALLRSFPEAIGGEMEGHGFCDVCSRKKVDWILVKAICDWADGNKGENKDIYQRQAADNAARFVTSVIWQYGLL